MSKKKYYRRADDNAIIESLKCFVAIPFYLMLLLIATICYLIEHSYNFIKGKGWRGMKLL
jgi:hypothetical protein